METRKCKKCGTEKPLDQFIKNSQCKFGRTHKCKECSKRQQRNYRNENRERVRKYAKEWYHKHLESTSISAKKYNSKIRLEVLFHYGLGDPICVCCGEKNIEFLALDHIGGGGSKHRKQIHRNINQWIKKMGFPKGFRILCHNCNQSRGYYGYCPHEKFVES